MGSTVRISFTNSKQVENLVKKYAEINILSKMTLKVRDNVRAKLPLIIKEMLEQTDVIKSLNGEFADDPQKDLPAHFGLTPAEGRLEARSIIDIFLNNLIIQRDNKNYNSLNIYFNPTKIESKLLSEIKGYTSINGFDIEWMDWLLNGHQIVGFNIVFGIMPGLDSRSGRALMRKSPTGSWSTSYYFYGKGDFLEKMLTNINRKKVDALIREEFKSVLKQYNTTRKI